MPRKLFSGEKQTICKIFMKIVKCCFCFLLNPLGKTTFFVKLPWRAFLELDEFFHMGFFVIDSFKVILKLRKMAHFIVTKLNIHGR